MDWTRPIDIYCERLDAGYWAEPINALSNGAFLVAALVVWHLTRGARHPRETALIAILTLIGIGSFLFHTHANPWSLFADVAPIGAFILAYTYAAHRLYLGWSRKVAALGLIALLPFAVVTGTLFASLPYFEISAGYWPVALLIAIYAIVCEIRGQHAVARGLGLGAGLLGLSLALRSLDLEICAQLPLGTHFLWHILNGVMLGWMILLHHRARTAA